MPEQAMDPEPAPERVETLTVRRAPKYGVFLLLGAVLGVIVAMVLTFGFHGTDTPTAAGVQYTQLQVFGFLALVFGAIGLAIGGAVALVLDRTIGRRSVSVDVVHERLLPPQE